MQMNNYSKHSLNEVAVLYIKDKILSGQLKSGDKLVETDISAELQISRAPVREAMRELNVHGLVTFSPRKGNYVLEMTHEEIMEIFEIRISLELQILRTLVEKKMLTEADFENLFLLTDRMMEGEQRDMPDSEKVYNLNHLDISFHSYLWRASGSMRRAQFLEGLFYQLLIAMNKDVVTLGTFEVKAREHKGIIEALKNGDLQRVMDEFHNHQRQYVAAILPDMEMEEAFVIFRASGESEKLRTLRNTA